MPRPASTARRRCDGRPSGSGRTGRCRCGRRTRCPSPIRRRPGRSPSRAARCRRGAPARRSCRPACRSGRRDPRARCARSAIMRSGADGHLVAQIEKLLAIGEHALIDLEHHRQDGGDEQRLALVAVLGAEIGRHALDLDRRHGLALADIGQRVGDVAEEAGELVGGARADRAKLDLAAQALPGAAKRPWPSDCSRIGRWKMSSGSLASWRTKVSASRLGVHGEERRLLRRRGLAGPIGAKDRYGATSSDGSGSLRPTPVANTAAQTAGNAYCRPRSSAGQIDNCIPHSSFHLARTNDPRTRSPTDRDAATTLYA